MAGDPGQAPRVWRMVNLTRIYTRTGDAGETRLGDMSIDDARPTCGCRPTPTSTRPTPTSASRWRTGGLEDDVVAVLTTVQNDLFDVGADFCTPGRARTRSTRRCASSRSTSTGSRPGATTTTRTCRSCGRSSSTAARPAARTCTSPAPSYAGRSGPPGRRTSEHADTMNVLAITYLNRLSRPAVHPGPAREPRATATCCGCRAASAEPSRQRLSGRPRPGRGGLEPGQEPGQRVRAHRHLERPGRGPAGHDDVAGVQRVGLDALGVAPADVLQLGALVGEPRPRREREDPEPLELVAGVATDAQNPAAPGPAGPDADAELERATVAGDPPAADDQARP